MIRFLALQLTVVVIGMLLQACQTKSESLLAPPKEQRSVSKEFETKEVAGPTARVISESKDLILAEFRPRLDILFVIDDSRSMEPHQRNLVRNIDRFVRNFSTESFIDFHVGVTAIWDSQRYGPVVKKYSPTGEKHFDEKGELKILKVGHNEYLDADAPRFVTADTPDLERVLRETLLIGAQPFIKMDKPEEGLVAIGPRFEEMFSPVLAAISDPVLKESSNKGFLRRGSHLVVIFLTDANDASDISPEVLREELLKFTGDSSGSKLHTYGALTPTHVPKESCPRDESLRGFTSGTLSKVERFLKITNESSLNILNLCSNFGDQLSKIGEEIRGKVLKEVEIYLNRYPEDGTMKISFGETKEVAIEYSNWTYSSTQKKIIIRGLDQFDLGANRRVFIEFTEVSATQSNIPVETVGNN